MSGLPRSPHRHRVCLQPDTHPLHLAGKGDLDGDGRSGPHTEKARREGLGAPSPPAGGAVCPEDLCEPGRGEPLGGLLGLRRLRGDRVVPATSHPGQGCSPHPGGGRREAVLCRGAKRRHRTPLGPQQQRPAPLKHLHGCGHACVLTAEPTRPFPPVSTPSRGSATTLPSLSVQGHSYFMPRHVSRESALPWRQPGASPQGVRAP